jgi:YegS/Rv2252/BmrU family lipid kinase
LIVNPVAGAGKTAQRWPAILDYLQHQEFDFDSQLTEFPGHAVELARSAAQNGYKLIVSVGGDGTINEVVNGLYESDSMNNAMLGILNTGTASDYIRTVGVPRDFKDAYQRLINPRRLTVDIGVVECTRNSSSVKRLFVNFAGLGFDAEIVKATTQKYKAMGKMSSYLLGLLTTLAAYKNKKVSITIDGKVQERKICTIIMGLGKYGGGGMLTTPNADLCDGLFDVLIVGDLDKLDLLRSLPRIYKGTHLSHPKVDLIKASEIDIHPIVNMPIQADGEIIGESPAKFRVLRSALTIAS